MYKELLERAQEKKLEIEECQRYIPDILGLKSFAMPFQFEGGFRVGARDWNKKIEIIAKLHKLPNVCISGMFSTMHLLCVSYDELR